MSVCTVVVAHVDRLDWVGNLGRSVDADHVFVDDGTLGEWSNHELALKWAAATAVRRGDSHVAVIQDDAIPIDLFRTALAGLIALRPDDLLGLYVGTHRPYRTEVDAACARADETGAMFLSNPSLLWGVGVVIPNRYVEPMLELCEGSRKPYDTRLGWAWRQIHGEGKPVLYPWPSLVDHRDTTPVVRRSRPQGVRVARRTGDPTGRDAGVVVPIDTAVPFRRRR